DPVVCVLIDVATGTIRGTAENSGGPLVLPSLPNPETVRPPGFFTADGKQFILTNDNLIRTFDSASGKPIHTLRGNDNAVVACADGPDGRLWSVEADGTLKQWNLQPPEPVRIDVQPVKTGDFRSPFVLSADGVWVARAHEEQDGTPTKSKVI